MKRPQKVCIVEVGPRDGLQNEAQVLSIAQRVALIDGLSASGLPYIEIGSFVRPDLIPPLADTEAVAAQIQRKPGVIYSALVPNLKGLERAQMADLQEIAIFMSATESHNLSNTRRTTAQALEAYVPVVQAAKAAGIRVRAYLSTVFGCPFEGKVQAEQILKLVLALLDMGAYQISLGDTIGVASPLQVEEIVGLLTQEVSVNTLALHMHDTRGTALANVLKGLEMGISVFDSSLGGLGGCPYAPGASGNLATEDLVYMLNQMQIETGVDLNKLVPQYYTLETALNRELPGKYSKTFASQCA